jgi:UPF0271 protein
MARVLLNIDAGEYPDEPESLFELAHVVSIACGGHAGDARSMGVALGLCKRFGTRAGAHPSFEDREGFGRRALDVTAHDLERSVAEQIGTLKRVAASAGVVLEFVKPHGALYHAADRKESLARAVVTASRRALGDGAFTVIGPPGGALRSEALAQGLPFAREGFADRGVRPDGSLIPRGEAGALVTDLESVRSRIRLLLSEDVETICVHADTPGSLLIARVVREELDAAAR